MKRSNLRENFALLGGMVADYQGLVQVDGKHPPRAQSPDLAVISLDRTQIPPEPGERPHRRRGPRS